MQQIQHEAAKCDREEQLLAVEALGIDLFQHNFNDQHWKRKQE